jgi:hypothetical protein
MSKASYTREERLRFQWQPQVSGLVEFILGPGILRLPRNSADTRAAYHIQRLTRKAGTGDEPAARILLAIATGAVRSLSQAATEQPELFRRIAKDKAIWPTLWAKLPVSKAEMQTRIEALGVGADIEDAPRIRLPFHRTKASYIATQTAVYMVEVFAGYQNNTSVKWTTDVRALDPFSETTAPDWWVLAKEAIKRSFPDLHRWQLGTNVDPRTLGVALRRVKTSFLKLWKLGTATSSVENQLQEAQLAWPNPRRNETPRTLEAVYAAIEKEYEAYKGPRKPKSSSGPDAPSSSPSPP